MGMIDFLNIEYLKKGTERQIAAYQVLNANGVLTKLEPFNAVLVGTIPINIDIESSDLDILCCWQNKNVFINTIRSAFEAEAEFTLYEASVRGCDAVVSRFYLDGFHIEIFGQEIPVMQQLGYRHMLIEYNLLMKYGDEFRQKVVALKKQGYKTEPAFGALLGLGDDPYLELLKYE